MTVGERLQAALEGRYHIVREIGAGGMAMVYLAEDPRHRRSVAIKVLRPDLAAALGADRFLREIEIAAQLTHPHILPLYDSGDADGLLYYVMPYVEGESLRDRLESGGALPIGEALRLLRDVADALSNAHSHGVVHRDIKPDNIMLSGRHALVTDFGVAKGLSESGATAPLTTAGMSIGTPAYMAPEQALAEPGVDHRADIYGFGVLAYEVLTGRLPFATASAQAAMLAHVTERPRPILEAREGIPPSLAATIMRCLEKKPDDRIQAADDLLAELDALVTPSRGITPVAARAILPKSIAARAGLIAAAVLVVGSVGFLMWRQGARAGWVRDRALPELERMIRDEQWDSAWTVAKQVILLAPGDSQALAHVAGATFRPSIASEPAGARVLRKAYNAPADAWEFLGVTPLDSVRVSRSIGLLRVELDGYQPVLWIHGGANRNFTLDRPQPQLENMVRIPGWTEVINGESTPLGDFFIDRFEVTNAAFKRFVDAGGYREERYWRHPFILDGRTLRSAEAMARFTDQTGRPGPSTWQVGRYPDGQDDFPVGGVSWHEAAAFAEFAGKSLPSRHHWVRAHGLTFAPYVLPASNLSGAGPARVGQYAGIGPFGTFDMAGNVREWAFNETAGLRPLLGGGWNDPDHLGLNMDYAHPAFDRSATNGFRLASYDRNEPGLERAMAPLPSRRVPDFRALRPISDEVLAVYRRAFAYDSIPLDARIDGADSGRDWVRQRISLNSAYGERMAVYLYLPLRARRPLQAVVYWPGSGAMVNRSFEQWPTRTFDFVIQSGRALVFPVLAGTFERGDGTTRTPSTSNAYRDLAVRWIKDVRRSVDYLQTRADIDTTRIAYFGFSWGGSMAPAALALEPRFKAAVLHVAGISVQRSPPEVAELSYLARVTVPVLMLNGRLDVVFPMETHAKPFFDLLGTPAARKRQIIAEGGHSVPRPLLIRESLDWLDRYLGPVAQQ